MFRTILAGLEPVAGQEYVLEYAVQLAAEHRLGLDAVAVIDEDRLAPREAVPLGAAEFKHQRDEELIASARRLAAEIVAQAQRRCAERGVPCQAQTQDGDAPQTLAKLAQTADLLVCGHRSGGDVHAKSLLHHVLHRSPRPAIVAPSAGPFGTRVLVAYDGSLQAARALAAFAQSGLARGRSLHVVAFDDNSGQAAGWIESARTFLGRHELLAEYQLEPLSAGAGPQILAAAARISAGLIVMGAYGRGRVAEFLFGSVTRQILRELPVPVFLEH